MPREGYRTITVSDELYSRISSHCQLNETITHTLARILDTIEKLPEGVAALLESEERRQDFLRCLTDLEKEQRPGEDD